MCGNETISKRSIRGFLKNFKRDAIESTDDY
jgi:hypothetical protein